MDRESLRSISKLGPLTSLGIAMPLSIVLGLGGGILLDRWLGTNPIFTLVGVLLGICAAFLTLYREVKRVE